MEGRRKKNMNLEPAVEKQKLAQSLVVHMAFLSFETTQAIVYASGFCRFTSVLDISSLVHSLKYALRNK